MKMTFDAWAIENRSGKDAQGRRLFSMDGRITAAGWRVWFQYVTG